MAEFEQYVSDYRSKVARFIDLMTEFNALHEEYNSLAIGGSLTDEEAGSDITAAEFVSGLGNIQAIITGITTGQKTTIYTISDGSHRR